jgi:phosphotransferase family enzyme
MTRLSTRGVVTAEHGAPTRVLANERYARQLLKDCIPQIASGEWQVESCRATDIRGGRRKPVALYDLTYTDGQGSSTRTDQLVAKVYRAKKHRAGSAHEAITSLWEAGFRPPSKFRVPQPYGYSARRSAFVQGVVRGVPWADFLYEDAESLRAASSRAAAWLTRLQQSKVVAPAQGVEQELARTRHFVEDLGRRYPGLRPRLQALLERLAPRFEADPGPLMPSHGDFHPKNVVLTDGLATVIDFDTFGLREPAFDVGHAMAQLLIMSHFRLGDIAPGAEGAASFWQRYAQDGAAPWSRVALHICRTYIEILHYVLYALETHKPELVKLWPGLVEYWLESDGPDAVESLIRGR